MLVLGISTACAVGGAAAVHGGRTLHEVLTGEESSHAEGLTPAVAEAMAAAEKAAGRDRPDLVAVARGPGSYTGLRIGVSAAKALAYAWDADLVGVSTLEAAARRWLGEGAAVTALLDARRERVVAAVYEAEGGGLPAARFGPRLLTLDECVEALQSQPRPLIVTGEGAEAYKERLEEALAGDVQIPRRAGVLWPADVAALGAELYAQGVRHDPFDLAPEYIRKPEAVRNWERRRLLKS